MSAYLFMVSNQGQMQKVQKARKHKEKKKQADDAKSTRSSRSSRSSGSFSETRKPKMVFDVNTSTYVPYNYYEKRLKRYNEKYDRITKECKYHAFNVQLNKSDMITEKNINTLRFTFFKKVTGDYEEITKRMKAKHNGKYKLKYMRKLSEIKTRERNLVSGIPNLSNDHLPLLDDDTVAGGFSLSEGDETEDEEPTTGTGSAFESQFQEQEQDFDDFDNLYKHYSNMNSKKENLSIKDLFKSNQFWNNIYQDLKFSLMELSTGFDYFELLPNLSQLINLYKEMVEYFLINLNHLTANTSDLTAEEAAKISKNNFFYFRDFNYEWFKIMSDLHYKFFNDQSVINSNLSVSHDSNFKIHQKLVTKIIETIIDNFKSTINDNSLTPVFELWEKFLNFMMSEMIFRNYHDNEANMYDNLPEPNLGRSRTSSVNSYESGNQSSGVSVVNSAANSLLTANTSTEENIQTITRNTKNLSINTHSLSNLSLNQSKISIIKEEDHRFHKDEVQLDMDGEEPDFLYKRKGFVIEPPTPRFEQGSFATPLSTSFSINSEDTNRSHSSKRSIFSKFRKNKIRV